jgi:quercetin dioxygenase-like cupin family protein
MNSKMKALFAVGGILLVPVIAIATPPLGILSNIIWGTGTVGDLNEHLVVPATADDQEDWTLDLTTAGNSAFTTQEVVTAPGGYSGWHHHPGLLGGIVKDGTLSWYDQNCVLHSYSTGQSFVESTQAHNAVNLGTVNTKLLTFYITKAGAPRRIEDPQPACAVQLGLP